MKHSRLKHIFVAFVFSGLPTALRAQTLPSEYDVKAAYLYNFAKFVEWPPEGIKESKNSLIIGVLGEDRFGMDLPNALKDKTLEGKAIVLKHPASVREASECRILFISSSEAYHISFILDALHQAPILTVSDMKGFMRKGGMIEFSLEQNRVRFSVNVEAAHDANLMISSQLLKLAQNFIGKSPTEDR